MTSIPSRMPAVFVGHGSPMNAIEDNRFTRAWRDLGESMVKPAAILAISAHWLRDGLALTEGDAPRTIHDFQGFPAPLNAMQYPAKGDGSLAQKVQQLLAPDPVALDRSWGLDHGVWSVLVHMFPEADVPVVQMALDMRRSPGALIDLGARLGALRDEGVLIFCSGNVVHHLGRMNFSQAAPPAQFATPFNRAIRGAIESDDRQTLANYRSIEGAQLSVPSAEHFLPFLICAGTRRADDTIAIATDEVVMASISMMSVVIGAQALPAQCLTQLAA